MSSNPKREMVLRSFRVFVEKICTLLPEVTANVSDGGFARGFEGRPGNEMWVIGFELGDGTSCCFLKLLQYH